MQLQSTVSFLRDIGRHAECLVEVHLQVSGTVIADPWECRVVLDRPMDFWTLEEKERAEQELIRLYELVALPFVVLEAA